MSAQDLDKEDIVKTIAGLKALLAECTPGPWHTVGPPWLQEGETWVIAGGEDPHGATDVCDPPDRFFGSDTAEDRERWDHDARLICAARNALPALIAEVERLREVERQHQSCEENSIAALQRTIQASRAPRRIQRRRTKGWIKPPGAVDCTRGSVFGNPITLTLVRNYLPELPESQVRAKAVELFERWLDGDGDWVAQDARAQAVRDALPGLRGRTLMCWCPPGAPCHADVLLKRANEEVK